MAGSSLDPDSDGHHRGERFQNNYLEFEPRGLADVLRWQFRAARDGKPGPPRAPTPRVEPELAFLHANAAAGAAMEPTLTWIGHASTLLQMGGISLLLDPVFSERASPFSFAGPKRHVPPGLALGELPHIDAVLVSHNHYDHLDDAAVRALAAQPGGPPRFVVPLGVGPWFEDRGLVSAVELDWWQATTLGDCEIVFTPAQHWSGRSLTDRMKTLWGGFAVFGPGFQAYYTGDTAYSPDFSDIHRRFAARHGGAGRGFDLALIPIGAYEPRWFMHAQHIDPAEALQIHRDVAAARSVGIHWGTFQLSDEALDEPPRALARACREQGVAESEFGTLPIGKTERYPRRPA